LHPNGIVHSSVFLSEVITSESMNAPFAGKSKLIFAESAQDVGSCALRAVKLAGK
jgi:hypothetical protein